MTFTHDTYLSPLTWRYGTPAMRRVWSEHHKRLLYRRFWVALARAQHEMGLVSADQLADLDSHREDIDLVRAAAIEAEIKHDLMAEIRTYAEQCPVGGGIIHLGATSTDVQDNVEALRLREATDLVLVALANLLRDLAVKIQRYASLPTMGYTHLQPAEPTTVGYRLAQYGYDLLWDWRELQRVRDGIRGKGLRGAVGTSASYSQLLWDRGFSPVQLEQRVFQILGLEAHPVGTQVYPRKQDWLIINGLAGLAQSIYRLAFDLRILQAPAFGEWHEAFVDTQVGSSAMPFKRNPINAENLDSLARLLAALPRVAWDNAAHSLLERTLDDSANRRLILPEAFLLADELVSRATGIIEGLNIQEDGVDRNLARYGLFAASERVLLEAVKAGGNRQELHEVLREHSLAAWKALQQGQPNPLRNRIIADERVLRWLSTEQTDQLLDIHGYLGDAKRRALDLAAELRQVVQGVGD
jgi:adenylosuccinate lyase